MHYGIHLPHAGERATPALIRRFALQAEALGFADVWVSEHIILPRTQFPRTLPFYEPVLTLTWVAAVTERVKLGTSQVGSNAAAARTRRPSRAMLHPLEASMSDIDWSACPDVERVRGRVSGQWVVVGTRILADGVIENADAGLSPEQIGDEIFDGLGAERARRIIEYARAHAGHLAPHG